MEAIDENVSVTFASKIDTKGGPEVTHALVEFAVGATPGFAHPHLTHEAEATWCRAILHNQKR
jgi:hypothetical protein